MKKVVLTGATGFLGFALLKELIRNNIYVYALCRGNSPRISRLDGLPNVEILAADLSNLKTAEEISGCEVFYHLAWEGDRNDFASQYKNVEMSVNCLNLATKLGCKRFICTGSQAEYGNVKTRIKEETPLKPSTSYGACKVATYYLTASLANKLGIEHTWVRVFSVYGPHDNANTLIMTLMQELKSNLMPKLTTDATHIWNYLYEDDAAQALFIMGTSQISNTVYNLAGAESKPLKDFVEELRREIRPDIFISYGTEKSPVNLNVSIDKLCKETGWSLKRSFKETVSYLLCQQN